VTGLRRKRNHSRPTERLCEPCEHGEVGVNPYALKALCSERREAELVLQAPEFALYCGTSAVESAPRFGVPGMRGLWRPGAITGRTGCSAFTPRSGMIAAQSRSSHSA
jgi:hypothetical protein